MWLEVQREEVGKLGDLITPILSSEWVLSDLDSDWITLAAAETDCRGAGMEAGGLQGSSDSIPAREWEEEGEKEGRRKGKGVYI